MMTAAVCVTTSASARSFVVGSRAARKYMAKAPFAQPYGWPGEKVTTDMPSVVNLRQDPYERTPIMRRESLNDGAPGYFNEFFGREMWRFVLVQQYVAKLARTALEYPPMQKPAVFNLDAIKAKVQETLEHQPGQ